MRKIILLLAISLCFNVFSEAQKSGSKSKSEIYLQQVFGESVIDFDVNTSPEKWKDESIVILCQKHYFCFDKTSGKNNLPEMKGVVRKRVLLQDKSALDYYSEFYYQNAKNVGMTIIKPDGSQEKLDLDDAVEVNADVPKHYRSQYTSGKYYKIAIPNLEVGDIVDYYTIYNDDKNPIISKIANITHDFPVVDQEYIFDVNKSWTLYFSPFNGAPDVEKVEGIGLNRTGESKKSVRRYAFRDKNRAAQIEERWDYTFLTEPTIKFMAVPKKGIFGDKDSRLKSTIENTARFFDLAAAAGGYATTFSKEAKRMWSTKDIKKLNGEEKVTQIYNVLKYYFLYKTLSMEEQKEVDSGNTFPFSTNYAEMRGDIFSVTFSILLNEFDVASDIVVIVPKQYGFTEDVCTNLELEFGVYVTGIRKFYWAPSNYTVAGDVNTLSFGASGYRLPIRAIGTEYAKGYELDFPESKIEDYMIDSKIDVTIMADRSISVSKNTKYHGVAKSFYSPLLLLNSTFAFDDIYALKKKRDKKKMDVYHGIAEFKESDWRAKRYQKKRDKDEEKLEETEEKKFDFIKSWIETEYEFTDISSFDVNAFGNKVDEALDVSYSFTSDSYVKKAGPNLIFDIGMLITEQVQLKSDEIEKRTKPIELGTAKSLRNEIVIELPDGMKAEGLESLNMNVDNESGTFISSAIQEGQTLKVTTSKIYKQEYLPVEKWTELVEMLEAAYKFSQVKVVLKNK